MGHTIVFISWWLRFRLADMRDIHGVRRCVAIDLRHGVMVMAGGVLVVVAWLAGRPAQWLRPSHVDEHGGRQRLGAWEKTGRTPGVRQPHPVEPVSWEPGDVATWPMSHDRRGGTAWPWRPAAQLPDQSRTTEPYTGLSIRPQASYSSDRNIAAQKG